MRPPLFITLPQLHLNFRRPPHSWPAAAVARQELAGARGGVCMIGAFLVASCLACWCWCWLPGGAYKLLWRNQSGFLRLYLLSIVAKPPGANPVTLLLILSPPA